MTVAIRIQARDDIAIEMQIERKPMSNDHENRAGQFAHVAEKVTQILGGPLADHAAWPDDRRWWLQLGFNLGRYSELSGAGKPVWDAWREAIETRDEARLAALMEQLNAAAAAARRQSGAS